jgi:hypothetical protein
MSTPNTLEQFFRVHDQAMLSWVQTLHVDYGDGSVNPTAPPLFSTPKNNVPIIAVFASPDRAFAQAYETLINIGWISGTGTAEQEANVDILNGLPLPLVSIQRLDEEQDLERMNVPAFIYTDDTNEHTYPMWQTYWFPYELNFWCQKRYTDTFIREWLYGQMGARGNLAKETVINVVHASPFGTKRQCLQLLNISDNSDLEGNDPHYLRFTVSVQLRAYLIQNQRN